MYTPNSRISALEKISRAFDSDYEAMLFLKKPQDKLGGRSPADLILHNDKDLNSFLADFADSEQNN